MGQRLKAPYRAISVIIILLLLAGAWLFRNSNRLPGNGSQKIIPANAALSFTKHASCRMACRGITETAIREVLAEGSINSRKSDPDDSPCPTYAIEDRVKNGQLLRIVFGVCGQQVKVITCIDLEQEQDCDCK
ncbi:MAG: DUF4258 domain-containing protein [Sphingobacteriales bacterium]|nr:MAG: DUF4258 domain-containing protein [Sphingobacteriales bacterium]